MRKRAFYEEGSEKQSNGDRAVCAKCVTSGADDRQSRDEDAAVRDEDTQASTLKKLGAPGNGNWLSDPVCLTALGTLSC